MDGREATMVDLVGSLAHVQRTLPMCIFLNFSINSSTRREILPSAAKTARRARRSESSPQPAARLVLLQELAHRAAHGLALQHRVVAEPVSGNSGSTNNRRLLERFGNVLECLGGVQECLGRLEPQNSKGVSP